jgi:uncharacterized protein YqjF (DUF2071 family)
MAQSWHDLLFAHWRVDAALLRPFVPEALEIDTFESQAWIAVVPFRMSGVRLRGTPALPWLSAFPELNVRTYVVAGGKPGVWFFSLDAQNPIAVALARAWFHLPYFRATMHCEDRAGWIHYASERTHRGAKPCVLEAKYRPIGEVFEALPGTLEHFLIERYCLYAQASDGRIFRGEIHHPPWQLQPADAVFGQNSMTEAAGIALPSGKPLLHLVRRQSVVVWNPFLPNPWAFVVALRAVASGSAINVIYHAGTPAEGLSIPSLPFVKNEKHSQHHARKPRRVIPSHLLAQIQNRKNRENGQGNELLNCFQLRRRELIGPDPIRGHLKAIFKEGNPPAHSDHLPQRLAPVLQMPVPCKGHEYVGDRQQKNGSQARSSLFRAQRTSERKPTRRFLAKEFRESGQAGGPEYKWYCQLPGNRGASSRRGTSDACGSACSWSAPDRYAETTPRTPAFRGFRRDRGPEA